VGAENMALKLYERFKIFKEMEKLKNYGARKVSVSHDGVSLPW
jgi:hypothetical protein